MKRHGHVRLVTEGDVAGHIPRGLQLLSDLADRADLGGVSTMSTTVRLDDDTYAYAVVAGEHRAIHIIGAQRTIGEEGPKKKTPAKVPDFLSGAVNYGFIVPADSRAHTPRALKEFHPTQACADKFGLTFGYQNVARLSIDPLDGIADLKNPNDNDPTVYAMSRRQKPTLYSGRMRKVVQALLGFGIQKTKTDARGNPIETSYYDTHKPDVFSSDPATPNKQFNTDTVKNGLKVPFDFHFGVSHGIAVGSDGTPWVAEIGITRGMLIMPLGLHPATTLPAFRSKLEHLGDDEGLRLLDEFGGFPTGEPMPSSGELAAWKRAGRVIQLLSADDLDPFYGNGNQAFGPTMGWAWNRSGNSAINTCFNYIGNTPISYHYEITVQIGACDSVVSTDATKSLKNAFEGLRNSNRDIVDAAKWKLDRLSAFQLDEAKRLFSRQNASASLFYVDSLVLSPLATATAKLTLIESGYFYFNAKIGPQIKFPNMALGYLTSIDFNLLYGPLPTVGHEQKCDTILFSYYQGDQMKVVKYYYDPRAKSPPSEMDDFEDCMYQGHWTKNEDNGKSMGPMFYTTDLDDRKEYAGSKTTTSVTGVSLGYCRISVADDIVDPVFGHASRVKRFRICNSITTILGEAGAVGICIPFFDRECYYYAYGHTTGGGSSSFNCNYVELADPWGCPTWRNFPGFSGPVIGGVFHRAQHPDGCGPVDDRTAMHPSPEYTPGACSDFADSGPWCHICDDIDRMTYNIDPPPLPAPLSSELSPTGTRKVVCVSSETWAEIVTYNGPGALGRWARPSPDPDDGTTDYLEATQNVLGDTDVIRIGAGIEPGDGHTILRGLSWPGLTENSLTFIGVV